MLALEYMIKIREYINEAINAVDKSGSDKVDEVDIQIAFGKIDSVEFDSVAVKCLLREELNEIRNRKNES
ncbi:hypothetical protein LCM23_12965 [Cytobacillus kochii]|uniref:hypothetical protein n=1 Tax=Cytobacillus kochii TaxID=859143 RepID=UPI001CD40BAF|nr:hypothetical protein [Cytobacillus kochii]MCA1027005.1 hypothetical protein [Cytobacillus kochii]